MNISLPPDLKKFVNEQVEEGGYVTPSEYICDLLRRARIRRARLTFDGTLADAVAAGATEMMDDADWRALRKAARSAAGNMR